MKGAEEKVQEPVEEFVFEEPDEYDWAKEKFEIMGIKMDIHKNGVLFTKELELLLLQLDVRARGPVGNFLIAYMKQTKKQTIQLPVFVSNIHKAYLMGKFKLKEMLDDLKEDASKNTELHEVIESLEQPQKTAPDLDKKLKSPLSKTEKRRPSELVVPTKPGKTERNLPPRPTTEASKELSNQAMYSRHTKSSLAHQRKMGLKKTNDLESEPKKPTRKPAHANKRPTLQKPEPVFDTAADLRHSGRTGSFYDNVETVAMTSKSPEKKVSSEERELQRCTFKPSLTKVPAQYQNVRPKLLEHYEASDSISEEAEFAYELKQELKKKRQVEWQNRSCDGVIPSLVATPSNNESNLFAARPLSPVMTKGRTRSIQNV